jgi:uncharacterized repeat protein (TIGR03843 family)
VAQAGSPADPEAEEPAPEVVRELLERGEMEVQGRFAASSNATLLVTCAGDGREIPAVYKPRRGERPLWDFPPGLDRREMAAYALSEELGWGVVPTTVLREEAPFGPGSVQHYLEDDGESHYFTLREEPRWQRVLQEIALLDVLANNADRKSGHVILSSGRLWAIDHGLCFHEEPKLRTVIWDYAGEQIPRHLLDDVRRACREIPSSLQCLLAPSEVEALARRARKLLAARLFPQPVDRGGWPPYPWPMV